MPLVAASVTSFVVVVVCSRLREVHSVLVLCFFFASLHERLAASKSGDGGPRFLFFVVLHPGGGFRVFACGLCLPVFSPCSLKNLVVISFL